MIKKIEGYFLSSYRLVDSSSYYLRLSVAMGLIFTIFIFLFDPYDNYSYPLRYPVPMSLVQIGYGLNLTFVIYLLYWLVYQRMGFKDDKRRWKTYHHWLLLILIHVVAGLSGTIFHRFFIDVGEVDANYYFFVTTPRSIVIGAVLITIAILYDKLHEKNRHIESLKNIASDEEVIPKEAQSNHSSSILLRSPVIKQNVTICPEEITHLKAFGNYVEIHLKNEERAKLLRSPLHFVAEQLTSFPFIKKCHRQYYININEVKFYKGNSDRILLSMGESLNTIPVSKKHTKEILALISNLDYR